MAQFNNQQINPLPLTPGNNVLQTNQQGNSGNNVLQTNTPSNPSTGNNVLQTNNVLPEVPNNVPPEQQIVLLQQQDPVYVYINYNNKTEYPITSNAVKLLPYFDNQNNYVRLYTELNSNLKLGDRVYILYDTSTISGSTSINIDSYLSFTGFTEILYYVKATHGYKVIDLDNKNNAVIIDKKYQQEYNGKTIDGHYLSKTYIKNIYIKGGEIDGVTILNVQLNESDTTVNDTTITQAIILSGHTYFTTFNDKFDNDYNCLKSVYNGVTDDGKIDKTTFINKNNNKKGFNYINNNNISGSTINNGVYTDCDITYSYITNGYFDNCIICGTTIIDGYYNNCYVHSDCNWTGGTWNETIYSANTTDTRFMLSSWNNGIWNNGNFYNKTWINGIFNNGYFKGLSETQRNVWNNGIFNGGNMFNTTWIDGIFNGGNLSSSVWQYGIFNNGYCNSVKWIDGIFNNGSMLVSSWTGGTFNNGYCKQTNWYGGTFNNGTYESTPSSVGEGSSNYKWHNGNFLNGKLTNSEWLNGNFKNGTMDNVTFYSGICYNTQIKNSTVYGGDFSLCKIYSSTFLSSTDNIYFLNSVLTDSFVNGDDTNITTIQDSTINNTIIYGANTTMTTNIIMNGCNFNSGTFGEDNYGDWLDGSWYYGTFRGSWTGGTFYNGIFTGTWYGGLWVSGKFNGTWAIPQPTPPVNVSENYFPYTSTND